MDERPISEVRPAVEVRYSARRRRRATASIEDGRIVVELPAAVDRTTAEALTDRLVAGLVARRSGLVSGDSDLAVRAASLADLHLGGTRPRSVSWSSRHTTRWGSCRVPEGDIRVSDRLRPVPSWVLDAVLVHELAHLRVPDHGPRFRSLVEGYARTAEAEVFLAGFALGLQSAGPAPAADRAPATGTDPAIC